jgi:hypothetical protein
MLGLQIEIFNASTAREIEAAFAGLVRDRADVLFVALDANLVSRCVQFATLATHYASPASYHSREFVEVGGHQWNDPNSSTSWAICPLPNPVASSCSTSIPAVS